MSIKRLPLRRCAACGESREKAFLFRIVRSPGGEILFDPSGKAQGRGAYVCRELSCVRKLQKKRGLDKSFHARVPEAVYEKAVQAFSEFGAEHEG